MSEKKEFQTVKLDGQFRVLTREHFVALEAMKIENTMKTEALNLCRLVLAEMNFEVKTVHEGALVYLMEQLKMPVSWHKTTRNFEVDYISYLDKKSKGDAECQSAKNKNEKN